MAISQETWLTVDDALSAIGRKNPEDESFLDITRALSEGIAVAILASLGDKSEVEHGDSDDLDLIDFAINELHETSVDAVRAANLTSGSVGKRHVNVGVRIDIMFSKSGEDDEEGEEEDVAEA